ncbi:hypothetical protein GCM10007063_29190 [Lentibacillus kapialis]|uniref:Uncharacterized protein n=1 Tax=Lentibacillus kapialis TaxID=340214 RepID=A0A917Q0H0_9BACI|nr:hypothetical protein GCM10007063_29190 [Lentibacillus kapialis]
MHVYSTVLGKTPYFLQCFIASAILMKNRKIEYVAGVSLLLIAIFETLTYWRKEAHYV